MFSKKEKCISQKPLRINQQFVINYGFIFREIL